MQSMKTMDLNVGILGGFEHELNVILGTPFAGTDKTALKFELGLGAGVGLSAGYDKEHSGDSYTSEFTTTWSYSTSGDPGAAG